MSIANSDYPYANTKNLNYEDLSYDYNAKFIKVCTVDCTRNHLFLYYDSGTENSAFLQIFIKNSTQNKQLMFYFLFVLFLL